MKKIRKISKSFICTKKFNQIVHCGQPLWLLIDSFKNYSCFFSFIDFYFIINRGICSLTIKFDTEKRGRRRLRCYSFYTHTGIFTCLMFAARRVVRLSRNLKSGHRVNSHFFKCQGNDLCLFGAVSHLLVRM